MQSLLASLDGQEVTSCAEPIKILSLSCTFPTAGQPQLGTFVRARLQQLGAIAPVKVIAPIAVIEYGNAARRRFQAKRMPYCADDDNLEILRPRWIYPPLGGCLNAFVLAAQLGFPIARLRKTFRFELIDAHFGHPDGIAAAILSLVFKFPFTITLRGNVADAGRLPKQAAPLRKRGRPRSRPEELD